MFLLITYLVLHIIYIEKWSLCGLPYKCYLAVILLRNTFIFKNIHLINLSKIKGNPLPIYGMHIKNSQGVVIRDNKNQTEG